MSSLGQADGDPSRGAGRLWAGALLIGTVATAGILAGGEGGCYRVPPLRAMGSAAHSSRSSPEIAWVLRHAIGLSPSNMMQVGSVFKGAAVIGLGEATHGQHESFEIKRAITMHAVREFGCRVVAYEASTSRAIACDDYIAGRSDDLAGAMKGFGMLIWQVQENAALLNELRAWNAACEPADRVRFIGIDVQDPQAAIELLRELLPPIHADLVDAAAAFVARSQTASEAISRGDSQPMIDLKVDLERWGESLESVSGLSAAAAARRSLCRMEIEAGLTATISGGARDLAMARMLLAQMHGINTSHPMVLWAHNAHVMHAPLRYLGASGERELAMGGHLREALGDRYVSAGFAFGRGSFNALDCVGEQWGFRTYTLGEPPADSLDATLDSVGPGPYVLNLRRLAQGRRVDPRVVQWLDAGHGQRWFGGYNVRLGESPDLLPTYPRKDFDVLVYLDRTSASIPMDSQRMFK